MTDRREHVIDARGISRRYKEVWAIRGIDLAVRKGEIFGLVGPDGAGKTTLLQLFAAILDPSEGQCRVLGFDAVRQATEVTARIGYMAQGFTLYPRLTVAENLNFAARIRGVPPAAFGARRQRLLAMAGLGPFLARPEGALSGGMRKKLALCANLIHEPPLLLLDEPGLGVDPLSRRELWHMLEDYRDAGTTVVVATSYMDEAERCDRLAFLDQGRLIAQDSPEALRNRSKGTVFQVRTEDPAAVERVLAESPEVLAVRQRPPGIRFAVDPETRLSYDLRQRLSRLGQVTPALPAIEDIFVVLRTTSTTAAPRRPVISASIARPPGRSTPPVGLEAWDLTRRFGSFTAVANVSLQVEPGEIFGLLGANGAGKTTLIRMLCGLLPPSSGTARVAGVDIAADPRRLRHLIGYMSQRFSLYPDLTVSENLRFFASAYGLARQRARDAIAWAATTTGLTQAEERPVGQLSGALRQRLGLACSLMHQPAVLFLDEPTSGVDPLARYRFWSLIGGLAALGTTVLVTTHYLDEASYCHRLGLMHEGGLIGVGDLQTLRAGIGADAAGTVEDVFLAYIERARRQAPAAEGAR